MKFLSHEYQDVSANGKSWLYCSGARIIIEKWSKIIVCRLLNNGAVRIISILDGRQLRN